MSKMIKIFVAALIALALGTPTALADSHHGHGKQSLVALGDSIPFGYNLGETNDRPAEVAFPYLIGVTQICGCAF
ncbi:hypothetical protein [Planococcus beijingensis]|uniref:hypothetical protein n=1 Tax=Planococcus beijingensis TaxID=2782551 RepID=UPI001EEE8D23|nr:hypothetical protein [Planococcus beijingensis]